ncbi:MAG: zinc metalloprotease HtpX [Armatimonadetes bacterium]|nr:zinc metalloprotease HtpX [Armatimonadota bacterium]
MRNTLKVGLMLTLLTAGFLFLGRAFGGPSGMMIAFGLAVVMNVGSYWFSDKIVLKMTGAQPVDGHSAPELFRMTEALVQRANLPMPRLYIIDDPQPNAFATGRNPQNAAVAVNSGLLNLLSREEVEGVVAHELAHVKHRDTLTMTIVATLAGAVMMMADFARIAAIFGGGHSDDEEGGANPMVFFALMIFAPIAAMLVQMTVSRAREYEADATAARLTGSPQGLMNALAKLERGAAQIPTHSMSPQTAHLCIVNPLKALGGIGKWFSTHPPMDKRIAALAKISPQPVSSNPWS